MNFTGAIHIPHSIAFPDGEPWDHNPEEGV
jgi:hypothetical protein